MDEKKMILFKLEEIQIERRKLEYYIESITEPKIRVYMQYRYLDGLSWQQVANHSGNDITDDGARKSVERYLKEERENKNGKLAKIR